METKATDHTRALQRTLIELHFTSGFAENNERQMIKRWKISPAQLSVLIILDALNRDEQMSMGDITARMPSASSNVSRIIPLLKKQNLVTVRRDKEKRSRVLIAITGEGRVRVDSALKDRNSAYQGKGGITVAEMNTLCMLLGRLRGEKQPQPRKHKLKKQPA